MSRAKARELTSVSKARGDDPACPICHPRAGRLREDQLWGRCPTNARHSHGAGR